MKIVAAVVGGVILLLIAAFIFVCWVMYQAVKHDQDEWSA